MTDGVLPALLLLVGVELEVGGDVGVDLGERGTLHDRVLDGHGDESHVRVGRSRDGRLGGGRGCRRVGRRADPRHGSGRRRSVTHITNNIFSNVSILRSLKHCTCSSQVL